MKKERYLTFLKLDGYDRKTYVFDVYNEGMCLGQVKWFGKWRKYTFFPLENTTYDAKCLGEIVRFMDGLMEDRKHGKTKKSTKEEV